MPKLWREGSWISAASAALLIALFSSHDSASEQRQAIAAASPVTVITKTATAPAPAFAASDATRQVSRSVRDLTDDLSRITTRLAAVERSIDDLTNTVMQQNQPGKDASTQTLPAWAKQETTSNVPAAPVSGVVPLDTRPTTGDSPPAADAPADNASAASSFGYGAEIGTATSMKMLVTRWTELRSAHAEVFESLKPLAVVKDNVRTNRVELRLVVSAANRAGAAKLCASLAALRIACQVIPLDGQQVAVQ
jgi:hypothetical protein